MTRFIESTENGHRANSSMQSESYQKNMVSIPNEAKISLEGSSLQDLPVVKKLNQASFVNKPRGTTEFDYS